MIAADRIPLIAAMNSWVVVALILVGTVVSIFSKRPAVARTLLVVTVLALCFITVPKGGV